MPSDVFPSMNPRERHQSTKAVKLVGIGSNALNKGKLLTIPTS
jgi:hypothetical protein